MVRDGIVADAVPKVEVVRRRFIVGTFSRDRDVLPRRVVSVKEPVPEGLGISSTVVTLLVFVAAVGVVSRAGFNDGYAHGVYRGLPPVRFTTVECSLSQDYHASIHAVFTVFVRLLEPVAVIVTAARFFPTDT